MHLLLAGAFSPVTTDAINLASAASTALIVMVPIVAGAMVGWHAFARANATDDSEGMQHQRRIRTTLTYAGVAELGMILAKAVLGFF